MMTWYTVTLSCMSMSSWRVAGSSSPTTARPSRTSSSTQLLVSPAAPLSPVSPLSQHCLVATPSCCRLVVR